MVQYLFNPDPSLTYLMCWWVIQRSEIHEILMSTCFSLLLWDTHTHTHFLVWLTSSFRMLWNFLKQKLLRNVILLECKVQALAWSGLIVTLQLYLCLLATVLPYTIQVMVCFGMQDPSILQRCRSHLYISFCEYIPSSVLTSSLLIPSILIVSFTDLKT